DLTNKKNQITRTEKEVHDELVRLEEELDDTSNKLAEVKEQHNQQVQAHRELLSKIAKLDNQVEEDHKASLEHSKRLAEYKSSHAVSSTIVKLDNEIRSLKNEHLAISNEVQ